MQRIIHIEQGVCRMPKWRLAEPVNFTTLDGEQLAIVGPNGGGKTLLMDIITGRHPLLRQEPQYDFSPSTLPMVADNIRYLEFRDTYGGDNDKAYYLQQRWNQTEIAHDTPTAGERLDEAYQLAGQDTPQRQALRQELTDVFRMQPLLDKSIVLLSSGELRKLQLVATLLAQPRVLILDNPFIGLDADSRDYLRNVLATLAQRQALQILLVLSKTDDIPDFITHVVEVKDLHVQPKVTLAHYLATKPQRPSQVLPAHLQQAILQLPYNIYKVEPSPEVIRMNKVSIVYGNRTILKDLDWVVGKGERWALSGQNGAGKSTLLSLVCADNPQSYACDISLFGHRRGSGESIWDIKRHIGYVSPEMHRSYQRDLPTIRVVASGLKDSVGLYAQPTEDELNACSFWLKVFGLEDKAERSFLSLSSGEQRLALLARAFVKDPDLLILDEPLHGLDDNNRQLAKDVIEAFCQRKNKTLVMVTHYAEELPPCIDHSLRLVRHA